MITQHHIDGGHAVATTASAGMLVGSMTGHFTGTVAAYGTCVSAIYMTFMLLGNPKFQETIRKVRVWLVNLIGL